ncbi:hypothetical protein CRE_23143 [Caenorhabditis remanei]|uniref:F-box associated domain-containing protein n=1 Tax=Caenorhabditis remanei TaxID=31234 RepID=E3NFV8_CAERE|nr:hypothetical protein CRE_23143 [Caenorhabditis remanei]
MSALKARQLMDSSAAGIYKVFKGNERKLCQSILFLTFSKISLTQTSQKTKIIVTHLSQRIRLDIKLCALRDSSFSHILLTGDNWTSEFQFSNSNQVFYEYQKLIDSLNQFFDLKTVSFDFGWSVEQDVMLAIGYVKSLGLSLGDIKLPENISFNDPNDDLLELCNGAQLVILPSPTRCHLNHIKVGKLVIENPISFNPVDLCTMMQSKSDFISNVDFNTDFDYLKSLNSFLRQWTAKDELRHLELKSDWHQFYLPEVVRLLDAEIVRQARIKDDEIQKFQPNECFRVKRRDGSRVLVYCLDGCFHAQVE